MNNDQKLNKYKILIVVPGIGPPNFSKKIEILENNLNYFSGIDHDVCIFKYSDKVEMPQYILDKFALNVVSEKGIIGDFLKRHITPEFVKKYTHVIILLDDVEIQEGFSVGGLLHFYEENNLDILSLSYTRDSNTYWEIMLSKNDLQGRVTNFAELMFYIMDIKNYYRYYEYIFYENPWMWGVDFLLYHMGFKLGILDKMTIKHYYGGSGKYPKGLPDPYVGWDFLKEKFTQARRKEPQILEYIY